MMTGEGINHSEVVRSRMDHELCWHGRMDIDAIGVWVIARLVSRKLLEGHRDAIGAFVDDVAQAGKVLPALEQLYLPVHILTNKLEGF